MGSLRSKGSTGAMGPIRYVTFMGSRHSRVLDDPYDL